MTTQPRNGRRYEFEGQQLTLSEIAKRVPCMSMTAIRNGLAKGRKTRRQLLSADARSDRRTTRQKLRCTKLAFGSVVR